MLTKIDSKPREWLPWGLVGFSFLLWAGALAFWLHSRNPQHIRFQLITVVPIFFWILFATLAVLLAWNSVALRNLYFKYSRRHLLYMAAAAALAWVCARGVAPQTHRIFYDEDIYEGIALTIAQTGQAAMTHDGRWSYDHFKSLRNEYNKQPNGWPFLLNLTYRVFGASEKAAFEMNHALFAAAVCLVFFCGAMLFESSLAGVFAALIYALIPENALWFSTVAVEPSAACASLLAMTLTLFYFRNRSKSALALAAVGWSLAVQFRPEALLLTGVAAVMFYVDDWEEFRRPALYAALVLFLVLISAHLAHMFVMRGESWGSEGDKLSFSYFLHNLKTNTLYYLTGKRFPVLFSVFALAGLGLPGMIKNRLYAGAWFLVAWGIFLFFYAGSYEYGADVRFALLSLAPLALLAGRGLERGLTLVIRHWGGSSQRWLAPVMVAFVVQFMWYSPLMRADGEEAWPSRRDHESAEQFARMIPDNGMVLTHNPSMFHLWGKNASQVSLVKEQPDYFLNVIRPEYDRNIYFHWNYWCEVPIPVQRSFCEHVLATYPADLLVENKVQGQRFALYRLKPAKVSSSASPKNSCRPSAPQ